jgi:hypothetical protein
MRLASASIGLAILNLTLGGGVCNAQGKRDTVRVTVNLPDMPKNCVGITFSANQTSIDEKESLQLDLNGKNRLDIENFKNKAYTFDMKLKNTTAPLDVIFIATGFQIGKETKPMLGSVYVDTYATAISFTVDKFSQSRFLNLGGLHPTGASSGAGWGEFGLLPVIHVEC